MLESERYSCSPLHYATATALYCRMESDLPTLLKSDNHSPGRSGTKAEVAARLSGVAGRLDDTIRFFLDEHILEMEGECTQWHSIVELTPRLPTPRVMEGNDDTWRSVQTGA